MLPREPVYFLAMEGPPIHSSRALDVTLLSETLRTKLPFVSKLQACVPLAGDASNRRYYRVHLVGGSVTSLVLMQLANPEGFKSSEEAVTGTTPDIVELPFVNIFRHLHQVGVPVPALYYHDEPAGLLYLEDFGDLTLVQACVSGGRIKREYLYGLAIDRLVEMHLGATSPRNASCLAFHRQFNQALLMWEFDHFLEYGIVARQGKPMLDKGRIM